MKTNPIKAYLRALQNDLWMRGMTDDETLAEIESHLMEAVERGQAHGLSLEDAERQALERFGTVKIVRKAFEKERKSPMQKVLLILGLLAGLFLAYVDSLPKWDDTGILVGALLLVSGLLSLLGYRRPWLLALAVGLWIPLHNVFISHDVRIFIVLIIPFAGAYVGWAIHGALRKVFKPAISA